MWRGTVRQLSWKVLGHFRDGDISSLPERPCDTIANLEEIGERLAVAAADYDFFMTKAIEALTTSCRCVLPKCLDNKGVAESC